MNLIANGTNQRVPDVCDDYTQNVKSTIRLIRKMLCQAAGKSPINTHGSYTQGITGWPYAYEKLKRMKNSMRQYTERK